MNKKKKFNKIDKLTNIQLLLVGIYKCILQLVFICMYKWDKSPEYVSYSSPRSLRWHGEKNVWKNLPETGRGSLLQDPAEVGGVPQHRHQTLRPGPQRNHGSVRGPRSKYTLIHFRCSSESELNISSIQWYNEMLSLVVHLEHCMHSLNKTNSPVMWLFCSNTK